MKAKFFLVILLIFISHTINAQWQLSSVGNNSGVTYCFVESANTLLAGTANGIFASTDSGNTWLPSNTGLQSDSTILSLGKNSTGIFAGGSNSIHLSIDNGLSWTNVNSSSYSIFEFAFLSDTVFAASMGSGVLMSVNNGLTWSPMNTGLVNDSVYCVVAKGNLLFAGTVGTGVFMSSNSGVSWSAVNTGLPSPVVIRSIETDGNNLYAGTNSWLNPAIAASGMFISSNNGASWTQITNGIPTTTPVFHIKSVGNALLAGTGIVYRSLDNGVTWTNFANGISPGCLYGAGGFYETSTHVFCGIEGGCGGTIYRLDRSSVISVNEINQTGGFSCSVYPNPTTGKLSISSLEEIEVLKIYNGLGENIFQEETKNQETEIDLGNHPKGIYIMIISTKKKLFTKKIIIE